MVALLCIPAHRTAAARDILRSFDSSMNCSRLLLILESTVLTYLWQVQAISRQRFQAYLSRID